MLRIRNLSVNSTTDPYTNRITLISRWLLPDDISGVYSEQFGCVLNFYPISQDESFVISSLESCSMAPSDRLKGEIDFLFKIVDELSEKEV